MRMRMCIVVDYSLLNCEDDFELKNLICKHFLIKNIFTYKS